MGKPGRPVAELKLSADESAELARLTRRASVNRSLAFRARLIIACGSGMTNTAVAHRYRTTIQTVGKWRKRFVEERFDGLYDEPRVGAPRTTPDDAVVFSFDEKSQIQALERAQPILPMDLGQPERRTHNYVRHGTLDLFAALNVATGEVIAACKKQHRAKDFVGFLAAIDASVEPSLAVHVVLDNLSAHKAPVVHRWLLRHPRFVLHFTPTYSSWLNLVERFFGLLTQQALQRGSHTSVPQLRQAIIEYVEAHNEMGKPFRWTKTADEILDKVHRFGLRTQQAHRG